MIALIALGCVATPIPPSRGPEVSGAPRAQVVRELLSRAGNHLVIVRYKISHDPGNEWVYNGAEIDRARIVWAREMDRRSNLELVRYFADRRAWLLEADVEPPRLSPYAAAAPPDALPQFVKLGTAEIEALRSPGEVERNIREKAAGEKNASRFTCDQWNYVFSEVTGFEAPNPEHGCFAAGRRADPVRLSEWFAWLQRQQ